MQVVYSAANEIEAAAVVGYLSQLGIKALADGGFTAGFIAMAPGDVKIVVRLADLDQAKLALAEMDEDQ